MLNTVQDIILGLEPKIEQLNFWLNGIDLLSYYIIYDEIGELKKHLGGI